VYVESIVSKLIFDLKNAARFKMIGSAFQTILIVSVLLKLLNLGFLCVCFVADFHSFRRRGCSSASDRGIYSSSPVWMPWPAVRSLFVL